LIVNVVVCAVWMGILNDQFIKVQV